MPELGEPVHPILEELETLNGRQAEGRARMFDDDSSTAFTATMRGPGRIPAFEKENA